MNLRLIHVARTKAESPEDAQALDAIADAARELDAIGAAFEQKIRASKALRGEQPTRLPRNTRDELSSYERDAAELNESLARDLEAFPDAQSVIKVLLPAMEQDVVFWTSAVAHTHPADVPILAELVQAKARLRDAMREYLGTGPGSNGAGTHS